MEYGLTNKQVAGFFGVSLAAYTRKLEEPEFAEIVSKARSQVSASLLGHAYKRATNGSDSVLIFLLKTRCGLSEKKIHEIVTNDNKPVLNINLLAGDKKS